MRPGRSATRWTSAPASRSALTGSVSSTCSTPSVASTATFRPVSCPAMAAPLPALLLVARLGLRLATLGIAPLLQVGERRVHALARDQRPLVPLARHRHVLLVLLVDPLVVGSRLVVGRARLARVDLILVRSLSAHKHLAWRGSECSPLDPTNVS